MYISPASGVCLAGEVVDTVILRLCRCLHDASLIVLSKVQVWYPHQVVRGPFLCGLHSRLESEKYSFESLHHVTGKSSVSYACADLFGIALCINARNAQL